MKDQEERENMGDPRIDKTIYTGRPENPAGRLEKEIAVYDFLDSLGVEYKRADHEALMTMEACEAVDQLLGAQICKNLFLCNRQKTDFYLLLMPGEKPFKTKFLSKQIGTARLSFAEGEQMEDYLNITPGSLSLMGLIFDKDKKVHLVIDREVLDEEYFGCHPCINTSTLLMKTSDVKEKILPALGHEYQVVELPTE